MARQLANFPTERRGTGRRHPWDLWMAIDPATGQCAVWELERDVDFIQEPEAFQNRIYTMAKNRGFETARVHTYRQAIDRATAERLHADAPRRQPAQVLPDLIRQETDPEAKKELKARLKRLKDSGREVTELLAVQFVPSDS